MPGAVAGSLVHDASVTRHGKEGDISVLRLIHGKHLKGWGSTKPLSRVSEPCQATLQTPFGKGLCAAPAQNRSPV